GAVCAAGARGYFRAARTELIVRIVARGEPVGDLIGERQLRFEIRLRRGDARVGPHRDRLSKRTAADGQRGYEFARCDECAFRLVARRLPWNRVIGQRVFDVIENIAEIAEWQNLWIVVTQVPGEAVHAR